MSKSVSFWAVVPAAGVGSRMRADQPKQYLPLLGKTVLEQTLDCLLQADVFSAIAVAIAQADPYWSELACASDNRIITAAGGKRRADSVLSALQSLATRAADNDWVLVHDAARPCLTRADLTYLINELEHDEVGGILALPCHDTLKNVATDKITETIDRSTIWRALTPQMFHYGVLKHALECANNNAAITDEASALELQGWQPKVVAGRPDNIKITCAEDLALARFYLQQHAKMEAGND